MPFATNTKLHQLHRIMDRLDREDDDHVRADLIHEAIGLADEDEECRREWQAYR